MADQNPSGFSPRRAEVALALRDGATNGAIARELGISVNTVAKHVGAVLYLTGSRNRTQAAAWAEANHTWLRGKVFNGKRKEAANG